MAGKLQQEAGKLVGSEKQQAKGIAKQIAGKVQKGVGDVKESLGNAVKK
ncbi:MAG TPA: CsbD family protein [Usitatibacter sp.]|nr:CsbD family protein [Usitatibacter sp.]